MLKLWHYLKVWTSSSRKNGKGKPTAILIQQTNMLFRTVRAFTGPPWTAHEYLSPRASPGGTTIFERSRERARSCMPPSHPDDAPVLRPDKESVQCTCAGDLYDTCSRIPRPAHCLGQAFSRSQDIVQTISFGPRDSQPHLLSAMFCVV